MKEIQTQNGLEIAIIGMSGIFPNSPDYTAFWNNLKEGKTLMTTFTDEELLHRGVAPELISNPDYVKTMSVLRGKDYFDAGFFGYTTAEGKIIDPQIRLFMQQCWSALEDAGYAARIEHNKIGLFAGAAVNDNWRIYVRSLTNEGLVDPHASKVISTHSFISTMVSHKLNLTGPSVFLDTACSTSLVAVHLACRSILTRECNMALAGGATVRTLMTKGYLYEEGLAFSKDGYTRSFDIDSTGTGGGEAVGVVLLKRLTDAINDRDHIYAVIKASAINNDGNRKVGYGAPSTQGQIDCIRHAQKLAKINPRDITYIEAHGTATNLGDPIEVSALNQAFDTGGKEKFCAIGSVKSNMGHSGIAAGVTGLMKTALSLKHKYLAPSLCFNGPNPKIDFDAGPFYVITNPEPWISNNATPLRAGVSAFGVGGTNAHVIMEEAMPVPEAPGIGNEEHILTLSAKTNTSLKKYADKLRSFLTTNPETNLSDLAYSLAVCRKHFDHRYAASFRSTEELIKLLDANRIDKMSVKAKENSLKVVFMFSGLGSQYPNMGKALYENNPVFRNELDKGIEKAKAVTGKNYLDVIFPKPGEKRQINEIHNVQPVIFLFEFALAKLVMYYGIEPSCMIGHSTGEYVAACLAGVFSFEDALQLVIRRGEMGTLLPPGAMLACSLSEEEARLYINEKISLAAVNGSNQTILSGDPDAISELAEILQSKEVSAVKLNSPVAGHSYMLDPYLDQFSKAFEGITLQKPAAKLISCVTADFADQEKFAATDYWVRHVRQPVLFYNSIQRIMDEYDNPLFIEIGPGNALTNMVKKIERNHTEVKAVNLIRNPRERENDADYWAARLGLIWMHGAKVNWQKKYPDELCNKTPLPTYAFEETIFPCEVNPEIPELQAGKKRAAYIEYRADMHSCRKIQHPGDPRNFIVLSSSTGLAESVRTFTNAEQTNIVALEPDELIALAENKKLQVFQSGDRGVTDVIIDLGDYSTRKENLTDNVAIHVRDLIACLESVYYGTTQELQRVFFVANSIHGGEEWNQAAYQVRTLFLQIFQAKNVQYSLIIHCNIHDAGSMLAKELLQTDLHRPWFLIMSKGRKQIWRYQEINQEDAGFADHGITPDSKVLLLGALGKPAFMLAKYLSQKYNVRLTLADYTAGDEKIKEAVEVKKNRLAELEAAGNIEICDIPESGIKGLKKFMEDRFAQEASYDGVIWVQTPATFSASSQINENLNKESLNAIEQQVSDLTEAIKKLLKAEKGYFWGAASLAAFNGETEASQATAFTNLFASAIRYRAPESANWKYVLLDEALYAEEQSQNAGNARSTTVEADYLSDLFRLSLAIDSGNIIIQSDTPPDVNNGFPRRIKQKAAVSQDFLQQMAEGIRRGRPDIATPYIAPETTTEKKIKALFEIILNIDEVGVQDNFFELGGDSLQGMMLLKRINKEFDREFGIRDFFQDPCVRAIADAVDSFTDSAAIEEGLNNEITI